MLFFLNVYIRRLSSNFFFFTAPLEAFTFNSNNTHESDLYGRQFEFDELMPGKVTCRAIGGNPPPVLRMYQNGVEITSEFDSIIGNP